MWRSVQFGARVRRLGRRGLGSACCLARVHTLPPLLLAYTHVTFMCCLRHVAFASSCSPTFRHLPPPRQGFPDMFVEHPGHNGDPDMERMACMGTGYVATKKR